MSDSPSSSASPAETSPPPSNLPHDSLKLNIILSSTICWFIAAFFVGLRFYTRGVIIRVLGWSDWSIFLALVCSLARQMRAARADGAQIFAGATCGGVIERWSTWPLFFFAKSQT